MEDPTASGDSHRDHAQHHDHEHVGNPSVGERVERAIERRVRPVAEDETGGHQKPRSLLGNVVWLAITLVSLYLVFPSLVATFSSWREITRFSWPWLLTMFALQVGVCACLWDLQRVTLPGLAWRPVIAAQLASNALSNIAPGGGPIGAALQYRMFIAAGMPRDRVLRSLTAVQLLVFSIVLGLPVLAVPTALTGTVNAGLLDAATTTVTIFVVLIVVAAVLLRTDRPLAWVGLVVQAVRNRLRRRARPLTDLPQRLLHQRDEVAAVLEGRWRRALAATIGRWLLDFLTLDAALRAIGVHPRLGLVLIAFCGAKALGNVPVTPGGLGFVEAGMTALLALAGINPGDAVLATFAYRLFSYWLPLPFGVLGMALAPRPSSPR